MKIIEKQSDIDKFQKGCVLTIGNFDGVHIGHQQILKTAKSKALENKRILAVLTFEPHPLSVLRPENPPLTLTPLPLKKHLLAGFGVDYFIVLKSEEELLSLSASDFVQQFLVKQIRPSLVVEGHDFNFGSDRSGSVKTLQQLSRRMGFEVVVVEPKQAKLSDGCWIRVSSTLIRDMLAAGRVADAAVTMKRSYRLLGRTVPGRGKGKELGFPTLNMEKPEQVICAEGVYAGTVEIAESLEQLCRSNEKLPAALSIGSAETLGEDNPLMIEAHLLEEQPGDLSAKWLAIDFVKYIREQKKFETEKELSEQMAKDCEKTEEVLRMN
ncbi:bifunctional riboflavin kinase/FAD synthetase [Planctomycetota bacterium]